MNPLRYCWQHIVPEGYKYRIRGLRRKVLTKLGRVQGQGETTKCRNRLLRYCKGNGVDLGFGGDPISPAAVRIDLALPYTHVGDYPVQLGGDASNLYWFQDNVLDYIYSSHLLEDFEETATVLKEWWRVLKVGGKLIIFCPDQQKYEDHCIQTNQSINHSHKHSDFSLEYVKHLLPELGRHTIIHERALVDHYSWEIVIEKAE